MATIAPAAPPRLAKLDQRVTLEKKKKIQCVNAYMAAHPTGNLANKLGVILQKCKIKP
jgi:hypothetical protein